MKCPQGNSCLKLVFLCEAQEVSQAGLHRTLSIRPSICPSNCPSVHPCTIHSSVHPTVHLSIHPSIHSSNRPPMQQTIVPFPSAGRCEWHCILSLIFVAPARWGCHAHSQLRTRGLSSSSHGPLGGHWGVTCPVLTLCPPPRGLSLISSSISADGDQGLVFRDRKETQGQTASLQMQACQWDEQPSG